MDRRKFLGILGSTAVVPLVPFKWQAPEAGSEGGPSPALEGQYRVIIDGVEYTDRCQSIEVSTYCPSYPVLIDLTCLDDSYRNYHQLREAGTRTLKLSLEIIGRLPFLIEDFEWHRIVILAPHGVMVDCLALPQAISTDISVDVLVKTLITFQATPVESGSCSAQGRNEPQ